MLCYVKPGTESEVLYDLICMWNVKKLISQKSKEEQCLPVAREAEGREGWVEVDQWILRYSRQEQEVLRYYYSQFSDYR